VLSTESVGVAGRLPFIYFPPPPVLLAPYYFLD
jgi:hypothetical protein